MDKAGNWGNTLAFGPLIIDRTAPSATSIAVNGHTGSTAFFTGDRTLSVVLGATGANFYNIQYSTVATAITTIPTAWTAFSTTAFNIQVPATDGTYYLHVFFKDNAGNVTSDLVSMAVKLDTQPPTCGFTLGDGTGFSKVQTVAFKTTNFVDAWGPVSVVYSNDGVNFLPANGDNTWTLSSGDGLKTVHGQSLRRQRPGRTHLRALHRHHHLRHHGSGLHAQRAVPGRAERHAAQGGHHGQRRPELGRRSPSPPATAPAPSVASSASPRKAAPPKAASRLISAPSPPARCRASRSSCA